MEPKDVDDLVTAFVDDASDVAAAAIGTGLAQAIHACIPERLAGCFAMRVALVLLREVEALRVAAGGAIARGRN